MTGISHYLQIIYSFVKYYLNSKWYSVFKGVSFHETASGRGRICAFQCAESRSGTPQIYCGCGRQEEATAKDTLERLLYQAESSKKQLSKEQRKELDEAVKRGKKAIKQKDVQTMMDCSTELERMLGTTHTDGQ